MCEVNIVLTQEYVKSDFTGWQNFSDNNYCHCPIGAGNMNNM